MHAIISNLPGNVILNKYKKASLIGSKITLTEEEVRQLDSNIPIERSGVHLYKENIELIKDSVQLEALSNEIVDEIGKKFYNLEEETNCLIDAFELGLNVLFYGRGGYGKSELTEHFFNVLYEKGIIDEKPFVFSISEGTTDDELFGGTNIKKLQDTGEIEYQIENSFMNHKYVIFEEMFDGHPQTLLSLKDILTSKRFRKGSQNLPIRTEMVVGLTNKSRNDFGTDSSKSALLDRFAFSMLFEWAAPTIMDYVNLFQKRTPTDNPEIIAEYTKLADVVFTYNNSYVGHISPRIALTMLKTHLSGKSLKYIEGMDQAALSLYERKVGNGTAGSANNAMTNYNKGQTIINNLLRVIIDLKVMSPKLVNSYVTTLFSAEYMLHILEGKPKETFIHKVAVDKEDIYIGQDDEFKAYVQDIEKELEVLVNSEQDEELKEQIVLMLAYVQILTVEVNN